LGALGTSQADSKPQVDSCQHGARQCDMRRSDWRERGFTRAGHGSAQPDDETDRKRPKACAAAPISERANSAAGAMRRAAAGGSDSFNKYMAIS
jgi:hypothetical protein